MIKCPECDGHGGWYNIDGMWMICQQCGGEGTVEDDDDSDDE
jgi:DnaJ-class molecular chaperone